ncbi:MAG: bifunctional serine/threonine-protein kinase/formylglycine-generating enzyme family protein [Planctomycetota bacterium]
MSTKLGRVIADKYELLELCGEGAHGMVYRAHHLDLGRDVAIKLLKPGVAKDDPTLQQRFLREVHLATSFVHRYAVTLRDFGRDGGLLYYTMDFVEGETLRSALDRELTLSVRRTVGMCAQILEALAEAHRVGVIHRDLKPSNVLLTQGPDGEEVRILDFGLAKAVKTDDESSLADLTMAGARVGTLAYMSPEQAMGRELDARSDLYAVGVLAYLALSGGRPCFPRRDVADPLQAFLFNLTTRRPDDLRELAPEVPREVCEVVMRALAKRPSERFADARGFRRALIKAAAHAASRGSGSGALKGNRSRSSAPALEGRRGSAERAALERRARRPSGEGKVPRDRSEERAARRASGEGKVPRDRSEERAARRPRYRLPEGIGHGGSKGEFLNERDGSLLVYIPPGDFRMGASRQPPEAGDLALPRNRRALGREDPVHFVRLNKGYFVGKTPVTWKQYRRFCLETGRKPPLTVDFTRLEGFDITDSHPAVNVRWKDARAYCLWAQGRLLTEAEWEYAARGDDGRSFPWGEDPPDARLCNWSGHPIYGGRATAPVGSFPRGHSPTGCLDMAGNVWEWTSDLYGDYPAEAQTDPCGPPHGGGSGRTRRDRVARGGSWRDPVEFCHASARMAVPSGATLNWLGFRLCRDAEPGSRRSKAREG